MAVESTCRSCGSNRCELVLDLGNQPLANNFLRAQDLEKEEPRFPLRVVVCTACWLMQITETIPSVDLFQQYLYFSSYSDAMLEHARRAAERYASEFSLGADNLVVEVASNDGYLLQNFARLNVPCLGIDPAENVAAVAQEKGVETIVGFFGESMARQLATERRKADVILGNNVFAHAPAINDFVAGLQALLAARGRVILEFPYAVDMVEGNEFDTVYHEHIFYFSLTALKPVFERHGLEIFHVERLPIHGGSLRLFAGHRGEFAIENSVEMLSLEESAKGVGEIEFYHDVSRAAHHVKTSLARLLGGLKKMGKSVAGYGASAKGSTLLNFVQPDPGTLDFIADRSPHKRDTFTPGLHVPVVGPEALLERRPDYTLLLTWNFAAEILQQQQAYRAAGGKFIIPVPHLKVVE
ncbi:MAG: SAM-dependent methyltransferase [uncultured Chthoniobacterales bacterium]|uniref:SAM-dependent methyltransferase n=1 Tax=uncultured Chthoniobacterales bacterium TaxID=1836801 RepID=A0A6J4I4R8_9BACT|nr:MAG: SAM-dependent methyltransferase [uncultured Chthoniobacterales bacterium]